MQSYLRKIYSLVLFGVFAGGALMNVNGQSSVLSSGIWYKIGIPNSGVYKLDRDFFVSEFGVDASEIDPSTIKIYGNGGTMLPQLNSEFRYSDLEENNILVVGEEDGVFQGADYILFYGQGTQNWKLSADSGRFVHTNNIYSDTAYYFVTWGGNKGKRMETVASGTNAGASVNYFDDYLVYEKEEYNIIKSGRTWYSEKFDFKLEQQFGFNLNGYLPSTPFKLYARLMGNSPISSSFDVVMNQNPIGNVAFDGRGINAYHAEGFDRVGYYDNLASASPSLNFDFRYNTSGAAEASGYIDYLEFNYQRDLRLTAGNILHFRNLSSMSQMNTEYNVGLNSVFNTQVWNITDPVHPSIQEITIENSVASFVETANELQEYVLFNGSSFPAPSSADSVGNQDLHALEVPNMLVISHPDFMEEAQRLADYRIEHDELTVEVVDVFKVYNEFSSGKQDITALRDLARMLYKRDSTTFKYLLLFGDCSYDYKDRIGENTNFVPVYESVQSLRPVSTYSSDDYFGFMEDDEGSWTEVPAQAHTLDIGVGRIICKTASEAAAIVNKIIHYSNNLEILGRWKNEITLIADDGDGNIHIRDADGMASELERDYPEYNISKIYLDAYQQIPTASGQAAPDANDALNRKISTGSFITNYTGHGGETGLAHEKIMTVDQINSWDNFDNLTLMFTATCEFGRYDDPERVSAGEYTVLNPRGGAVAIITTSRPVNSGSNFLINTAFFDNVFEPLSDGSTPRLGDIMIKTKNSSISGIGNRNFTLLGDPSMKLAYPMKDIVLTTLNGDTIGANSDTLKALSQVVFEGEVRDGSGNLMQNFNGTVDVRVFDKESSVETFGDESEAREFDVYKDIIFSGKSTVTNGRFSFKFVVPKDINYQFGTGKISMYAQSDDTEDVCDANGASIDVKIGGSDPNAVGDDDPPLVESFMDDFSFVFGGMTGTDPILLAKLSDENGINTAGSGIGHEITAILDDDREGLFVLNEYYTADQDSFTQGTVEFPLFDLEPGLHTLRVKAWDVYNNSGEDYLEFLVVDSDGIEIDNLLNFPNPFTTSTQFHFDHNMAGQDLEVNIQIMTLSGRTVRTINFDSFASPSHVESPVFFDGRDDWGDKLARGVYIYRLNVRSSDEKQAYKIEKMLLLK